MLPCCHGWVLNNVALSYLNWCMGVLPHLYGCLVIISRIIEAILWPLDCKETLYEVFLPFQLRAHKMIFHYSESEQMDLNTLAHIRFWVGLRRGGHWAAGVGSPGGWGRCPTQGGWHALQPMLPTSHPEKSQDRDRWCYSQYLLVGAIPPSLSPHFPIHTLPSRSFPLPFFPAKIFQARSNPGSNTVPWDEECH